MSDPELSNHPHDIELRRRAVIFHEKLDAIRAHEGEPPWQMVLDAAAASHFLYDAKIRSVTPDVWERPAAIIDLINIARGGTAKGVVIPIGFDPAQEMIFRAYEDPDNFEMLKLFCSHAATGKPVPHSDETTFELHPLLLYWFGQVAIKAIGKPKTRKNQGLKSDIINKAIADTVQFLHDTGLPIFRNDVTKFSTNACDAVAKISGEALGRKPIKGHAIQKIYYASEWAKWRKLGKR